MPKKKKKDARGPSPPPRRLRRTKRPRPRRAPRRRRRDGAVLGVAPGVDRGLRADSPVRERPFFRLGAGTDISVPRRRQPRRRSNVAVRVRRVRCRRAPRVDERRDGEKRRHRNAEPRRGGGHDDREVRAGRRAGHVHGREAVRRRREVPQRRGAVVGRRRMPVPARLGSVFLRRDCATSTRGNVCLYLPVSYTHLTLPTNREV